jgi:hypothetical protein
MDQMYPVAYPLLNEKFVILWQSYNQNDWPRNSDNSDWGVYIQLYNVDGTRNGRNNLINQTTAGHQYSPQIKLISNGSYIISWIIAKAPF